MLAEVGDGSPPLLDDTSRRAIHQPAPPLSGHPAEVRLFSTGIKLLDLLAPLAQDAKAAMFGGAGARPSL